MSIPRRIDVGRVRAPVHEDLAIAVDIALEEKEDVRRRLQDAPRIRRDARHAGRQTVRLGIVLRLPRRHQRAGRGQEWNGLAFRKTHLEITDRPAAVPDAGEIGLAIRRSWDWTLWCGRAGPRG